MVRSRVAESVVRRGLFVAAGLAVGLGAGGTAIGQSITPLGTLAGFDTSYPAAISPDGTTIVGRAELLSSSGSSPIATRAFRWTTAGGMQDLGTFSDTPTSVSATAVANDGTIVGTARIDGAFPSGSRAFRWTPSAGLQPLTGAEGMSPRAISADGSTIVGSSPGTAGGQNVAVFRGGVLSVIPGIDGANNDGISGGQSAYGVNADGSVVVGETRRFSTGQPVAFRWTSATGATAIASPGTRAAAVSADGSVVIADRGGASTPFQGEIYRWTSSGTETIALTGFGGVALNIAGMSGDGRAAVGSMARFGPEAIYWTPELGVVRLSTYLPTLGIDLTGWTLTHATAISADGSRLVGYGQRVLPSGLTRTQGFLVVIPSPGAAGLLVVGAGVIAGRRRRMSPVSFG